MSGLISLWVSNIQKFTQNMVLVILKFQDYLDWIFEYPKFSGIFFGKLLEFAYLWFLWFSQNKKILALSLHMQKFQSHFCEMVNFRCSRRYRTIYVWPMCETDTRILSNMAFFISFSHTSDLRSIIIPWFMIHKNLWDFLIIMIDREWSPSQIGLFPGSIIRHFKSDYIFFVSWATPIILGKIISGNWTWNVRNRIYVSLWATWWHFNDYLEIWTWEVLGNNWAWKDWKTFYSDTPRTWGSRTQ